MIKTEHLVKRFGDFTALEALNTHIVKGSIYGLVGSNGSGKSTFLRLLSGIYRPDEGVVRIDGQEVFENTALKQRVFFLADELYFLPQSDLREMVRFYTMAYPTFSKERYKQLEEIFNLPEKKKLNTFSKGMKRQAALMLGLACQPELLLLDEAFDGLDPVIRMAVKKILYSEMSDRNMTVLVTSHNLRELEELCDCMGLLHKGKILFEREIDELKLGFCKVQAVLPKTNTPEQTDELLSGLKVLQKSQVGSMVHLVVRGSSEDACAYLTNHGVQFAEGVPLTLEEVFIHEMEAVGYDYSNILI